MAFKRAIVKEYEQGGSIPELKAKYGINGGSTIQGWVKKYGREGLRHKLVVIQQPEEQNRVKELERKISQLEKIVGQLSVEKLVLESSLAEAEARLGYELAKKPERRLSNGLMSKPKRKDRRSR
jgi:transposase-like protein